MFLFGFLIFLIKETRIVADQIAEWREAFATTPVPKGKLVQQWERIQRLMGEQDEEKWKMAIIQADNILDEIIKAMGFSGSTMGERLKKIKPVQFPLLDDAWRVHKVRNFIAHDPTYTLQRPTAQRAIEVYERIFRELGLFT